MRNLKLLLAVIAALSVTSILLTGCNKGMGEKRQDPTAQRHDKSND